MTNAVPSVQLVRVREKPAGPWVYMEPCELASWIMDADKPAEFYEAERVTMTVAEFEALPEFEA
jgi:hypothetical protein